LPVFYLQTTNKLHKSPSLSFSYQYSFGNELSCKKKNQIDKIIPKPTNNINNKMYFLQNLKTYIFIKIVQGCRILFNVLLAHDEHLLAVIIGGNNKNLNGAF